MQSSGALPNPYGETLAAGENVEMTANFETKLIYLPRKVTVKIS